MQNDFIWQSQQGGDGNRGATDNWILKIKNKKDFPTSKFFLGPDFVPDSSFAVNGSRDRAALKISNVEVQQLLNLH